MRARGDGDQVSAAEEADSGEESATAARREAVPRPEPQSLLSRLSAGFAAAAEASQRAEEEGSLPQAAQILSARRKRSFSRLGKRLVVQQILAITDLEGNQSWSFAVTKIGYCL